MGKYFLLLMLFGTQMVCNAMEKLPSNPMEVKEPRIHFTSHANERMVKRRILRDLVEHVIKTGERSESDNSVIYTGKRITVVMDSTEKRVITVYTNEEYAKRKKVSEESEKEKTIKRTEKRKIKTEERK